MSALPESLPIGVPFIDAEHAALIAHLNRLQHHPEEILNLSEFAEALSLLNSQLIDHIVNEEKFMRTSGVPAAQLARHFATHNQAIEQVTQLSFDLMKRRAFCREDVIGKVRGWIVDHLTAHDLGLRSYATANAG